MEILLLKEHTDHSGCRAVSEYLRSELSKIGGVVTESDNPDLVVVNGEGSFHHNYGTQYLSVIGRYPEAKKILVNALWQDSKDNLKYLHQFSYIGVREILSQRDLIRSGVDSKVFLDLSFNADVELTLDDEYKGKIVMGDHFLSFDHRDFSFPVLGFRSYPSWSGFLSKIRSVKLYITGYHHAVYACCKMRTPFIPYAHNSHKIEGLFRTAGVSIPIPENAAQVYDCIDWAQDNLNEYQKLFDFMASCKPWTIDELSA